MMDLTVLIKSKNGIVKRILIDNGPGQLRILKWNGWCLRSASFRQYLMQKKSEGAQFVLNSYPLKVQYQGMFMDITTKAKCGCGCKGTITWETGYVPDHGPPYYVPGHNGIMLGAAQPGTFKKGHVPWTKGKKGYFAPGSEKGWFKKGHYSERWKDYPTPGTRLDKDGYVYTKSDDPNDVHPCGVRRYINVSRATMEKILGRPLEENEVVMHLDEDPGNNDPGNLRAVTRSEAINISRHKLHRGRDLSITSVKSLSSSQTEEEKGKHFDSRRTKKPPAKRKKSVTPKQTVTESCPPEKSIPVTPKVARQDRSRICPKCKTLKPPMSRCPRCD